MIISLHQSYALHGLTIISCGEKLTTEILLLVRYVCIVSSQPSHISPDIIRAGGDGFLHGGQTEDLQEVVLHHVPDDAELVKVATPTLGTEGFLECDGDAGNVVSAPGWTEDHVSKS